jgi:drug/metabolite transporter (DMT)-like permease
MKVLDLGRLPAAVRLAGAAAWERFNTINPVAVGLALAFMTALISGLAIYVNSYAAKEFPSPTLFTTLKNSIVGLALLALVARPSAVREVRALSAPRRAGLLSLAVVGGSVPFVLFFEGLTRVTSGNAAFLHKTLFIWVAVLAVVFLRERIGRAQLGALALLVLAQYLLGGPGDLRLDGGSAMVFAGAFLWAVEAVVAKRVLEGIGSNVAATSRMALGAVLLIVYLAARGELGDVAELGGTQWAWLLATGMILFGYVTTWYAALQRAPATAVTCVLTIGAPITAALDALAGRGLPDGDQLVGYAVLVIAVAVLAVLARAASRDAGPAFAAAST